MFIPTPSWSLKNNNNTFAQCHKVVTSEALGPGSTLVSRGRRESLGKKNVFSLDLKTATESLLRTVFGNEFQTASAEDRKVRFANVVTVRQAKQQHRRLGTVKPAFNQTRRLISQPIPY